MPGHFPPTQNVGCGNGHHPQEVILAEVIIKHLEEDVAGQGGVVHIQLRRPVPARILSKIIHYSSEP